MTSKRADALLLGLALLALPAQAEGTAAAQGAEPGPPASLAGAAAGLETVLAARFGDAQRPRARRGIAQVGRFWRQGEDGDEQLFVDFVRGNFAGDAETLDTMFERFEGLLEKLDGHMTEMTRALREIYRAAASPHPLR